MSSAPLPLKHFALAVAVVFVWGLNFVVIKMALHELPPLVFAALRFTFVFFPAIFFLKKPDVSWRNLAAYGILIGAGQFGLLFIAMRADISPGLASLIIQAQVFFTIGLSMMLSGERMKLYQLPALALAIGGIVVIGVHTDGSTTVKGLLIVLLAALCWAGGNIASKRAGTINALAYVVWSSIFASPCLIALALIFEGPQAAIDGITHASPMTWAAIAYQSIGNSLFGYAAWAWLLARHPASTITPTALLVPVFGIGASVLLLGEPLPAWKIIAAAMVMGGLAVNLLWPRVFPKIQQPA